jgi:hypothetical protein
MLAHADAQQCDAMHEAAEVERAVGSLESTAHALESTAAHAVSLLLQLQYQHNTHRNLLAAREELRIAQEDAKVAVEDAKEANRQVHTRDTPDTRRSRACMREKKNHTHSSMRQRRRHTTHLRMSAAEAEEGRREAACDAAVADGSIRQHT